MRRMLPNGLLVLGLALSGCGIEDAARRATTAPTIAPTTPGASVTGTAATDAEWTNAALAALRAEGATLLSTVPADVMKYCPGYATQTPENRAAFWAGLATALARQQGGMGGRLGPMRISGSAATENGCDGAMGDVSENLHCAVRIMARHVTRDGTIAGAKSGWRGLAREWLALRSPKGREGVASLTRRQGYCES